MKNETHCDIKKRRNKYDTEYQNLVLRNIKHKNELADKSLSLYKDTTMCNNSRKN